MRVTPVLTTLLALSLAAPAWAAGEDESRWNALREMLFKDRPIHDAADVLTLDAPYRAHDAAVVPISVEPAFSQTEERYIKSVTLLIDENPLPLAGRFHFTPASGRAAFSTRVRVNAYTNIRAIAETNDGELHMAKRFVKASGGCSAPAGKDPDAALARLGKMKLRQSDALVLGEPNLAHLLVSHPNHTGMQMDQVTRHYVPAYFVNNIEVRYGDVPVLTVESDISLSEDPSIHFYYTPRESAELSVTVTDSKELVFSRAWEMQGKRLLADAGNDG
jgi:sulfur-oxidizing protein SoxY